MHVTMIPSLLGDNDFLQSLNMKWPQCLVFFLVSAVAASAVASDEAYIPAGASITYPRSWNTLYARLPGHHSPKKDNWGNSVESDRKKVTIRASKDDHDDISEDFLWALKKANQGGLVHLKKEHKYVIGKKLDLTFLSDVYVKIDGELKVRKSMQFGARLCS